MGFARRVGRLPANTEPAEVIRSAQPRRRRFGRAGRAWTRSGVRHGSPGCVRVMSVRARSSVGALLFEPVPSETCRARRLRRRRFSRARSELSRYRGRAFVFEAPECLARVRWDLSTACSPNRSRAWPTRPTRRVGHGCDEQDVDRNARSRRHVPAGRRSGKVMLHDVEGVPGRTCSLSWTDASVRERAVHQVVAADSPEARQPARATVAGWSFERACL